MRNKQVYCLAVATALFASISTAFAAGSKPSWKGTIAVSGDKHPESQLKKLAKVSKADATKTALAAVASKSAKVEEGELEVENGFLIYAFDIKVKGQAGIEEILVDAGDGKVLAHEHESPAAEAKEKKGEKSEKGEKPEKGEKSERK